MAWQMLITSCTVQSKGNCSQFPVSYKSCYKCQNAMERCWGLMVTPYHRTKGTFFIKTKYVSLPVYQGQRKVPGPQVPGWCHMILEVAAKFSHSLYGLQLGPFLTYESPFPWSHDIFQWDQGAAVKWGINDIPVLNDSEEAISSPLDIDCGWPQWSAGRHFHF